MKGHEAMVAFKVESWIWYSVVLLIAISRLYASSRTQSTAPEQPLRPCDPMLNPLRQNPSAHVQKG